MTMAGGFGQGYKPTFGFNTTRYNQPTLASATPVAWTTGNSPVTLYTVTGTILCRVYGTVGATGVTSTSNTGTLAIGIASTTGLFLAATTADATNLPAGAIWIDTSPTLKSEALVATNLTWVLLQTANVILTIATNSMTAGAVALYMDWIPISPGATVVSGSP